MLPRTSAGGNMFPASGMLAGMVLLTLGTASTAGVFYAAHDDESAYERLLVGTPSTSNTAPFLRPAGVTHTDAGPAVENGAPAEAFIGFRARDAIFELRRLTGLTWEEMADLLGVSRRSLHLWANGHPINALNEKRVRDLVNVLRMLDRGTARENRELLISSLPDGGVFFDLLRNQRFEEALVRAGRGSGRPMPLGRVEDDTHSKAGRMSVADMLGTNAERVHTDDAVALPRRRRSQQT